MYLLLENALVGWVTILVELLVAVLLMVYKIWLDYGQRYALDPRPSIGNIDHDPSLLRSSLI